MYVHHRGILSTLNHLNLICNASSVSNYESRECKFKGWKAPAKGDDKYVLLVCLLTPKNIFKKNNEISFGLFLSKETDTTGRHTRACSWTLTASPPPYGLILILTGTLRLLVPNQPGQGGGALQHRSLTSTIVIQISLYYLLGRTTILFQAFSWTLYSLWNSLVLNILNNNLTAELNSHDKCYLDYILTYSR